LSKPDSRQLLLELELPARLENLHQFLQAVTACALEQGIQSQKVDDMELALDEILVNICNYAYQDQSGNAKITCSMTDDKRLILEVEDSGVPFNALSVDAPDLTADIEERKVGGLGIYFMKTLMDDVRYTRKDNKNILTMMLKSK